MQVTQTSQDGLKHEFTIVVGADGQIAIKAADRAAIEVKGDVDLRCENCQINASGSIDLGEAGSGVITTASHKCYFTGAPLIGSTSVKAKG